MPWIRAPDTSAAGWLQGNACPPRSSRWWSRVSLATRRPRCRRPPPRGRAPPGQRHRLLWSGVPLWGRSLQLQWTHRQQPLLPPRPVPARPSPLPGRPRRWGNPRRCPCRHGSTRSRRSCGRCARSGRPLERRWASSARTPSNSGREVGHGPARGRPGAHAAPSSGTSGNALEGECSQQHRMQIQPPQLSRRSIRGCKVGTP
mmetsp:Transcript_66554/g.214487  ORF Transcript_66554/g.214487 Transcript_66554/m.214487 type:complete len:202 (+) Transcript_66554:167-772(+)